VEQPTNERRPAPASTPATLAPAGSTRHLEFISGSSRKFWEISLSGNSFTVRFGRIGTPGQSQTKTFADESTAKHEADRLLAEKLKKGYLQKSTSSRS
jgi:predicted DNA-binding WGR domain protein